MEHIPLCSLGVPFAFLREFLKHPLNALSMQAKDAFSVRLLLSSLWDLVDAVVLQVNSQFEVLITKGIYGKLFWLCLWTCRPATQIHQLKMFANENLTSVLMNCVVFCRC